jgi:hypothetical protein
MTSGNASVSNENCDVFLKKNLKCEICKTVYSFNFCSDDKMYDLIELSKPANEPFILFELFSESVY